MIRLKSILSLSLILIFRVGLVLAQPVIGDTESNPENDATDVKPSSTSVLVIKFDTFIKNPISSILVTYDEVGGVTNEPFTDYTVEYPTGTNSDRVRLKLNAGVELVYGATYTVDLTGVESSTGNNGSTNTDYIFTTLPKKIPVVSVPTVTTGILIDEPISLTVDRSILQESGSDHVDNTYLTGGGTDGRITLSKNIGTVGVPVYELVAVSVVIGGNTEYTEYDGTATVTIDISSNLEAGTNYVLSIGVVKDALTGGLSASTTYAFATEPIVKPVFSLYEIEVPTTGAVPYTYVSSNAYSINNYNYLQKHDIRIRTILGGIINMDQNDLINGTEAVIDGMGGETSPAVAPLLSLFDLGDDLTVDTDDVEITITSASMDHSDQEIVISGVDLLYGKKTYEVRIQPVTDERTGGVSSALSYKFETPPLNKPVITLSTGGTTVDNFSVDSNIILNSDLFLVTANGDELDHNPIQDGLITFVGESTSTAGFGFTATYDDSGDSGEITINPTGNLEYGEKYTLTLDAVRDARSGGEQDADNVYTITTPDKVKPNISLFSSQTGVSIYKPIVLKSNRLFKETQSKLSYDVSTIDADKILKITYQDYSTDPATTVELTDYTVRLTVYKDDQDVLDSAIPIMDEEVFYYIIIDPVITTGSNSIQSSFDVNETYTVLLTSVEDVITGGESERFEEDVSISDVVPTLTFENDDPDYSWCDGIDDAVFEIGTITLNEGLADYFQTYDTGNGDIIRITVPEGYKFVNVTDPDNYTSNNLTVNYATSIGDIDASSAIQVKIEDIGNAGDDGDSDPNDHLDRRLVIDISNESILPDLSTGSIDVFEITGLAIAYDDSDMTAVVYGSTQQLEVELSEGVFAIGFGEGADLLAFVSQDIPSLDVLEVSDNTFDTNNETATGVVVDGTTWNVCDIDEADNDFSSSFDFNVSYSGGVTPVVEIMIDRSNMTVDKDIFATYDATNSIYTVELGGGDFTAGDKLYVTSTETTASCAASTLGVAAETITIDKISIPDEEVSFTVGSLNMSYNEVELLSVKSEVDLLVANYDQLLDISGTFYSTTKEELIGHTVADGYSWNSSGAVSGTDYYIGFLQTCTSLKDYNGVDGGAGVTVRVEDTEGSDRLKSDAIINGTVCRNLGDNILVAWSNGEDLPNLIDSYTISCDNCGDEDLDLEDVIMLGDDGKYYMNLSFIPVDLKSLVINITYQYEENVGGIVSIEERELSSTLIVSDPTDFTLYDLDTQEEVTAVQKYCEGDNPEFYITLSGSISYQIKRLNDPEDSFIPIGGDHKSSILISTEMENLAIGTLNPGYKYTLRAIFTNSNNCISIKDYEIETISAPQSPISLNYFVTNDTDTNTDTVVELQYCFGQGGGETLATIGVDSIDYLYLNWYTDRAGKSTFLESSWSFDTNIDANPEGESVTEFEIQLESNVTGCVSEVSTVSISVGNVITRTPSTLYNLINGNDDSNIIKYDYCEGQGGESELPALTFNDQAGFSWKWYDIDGVELESTSEPEGWSFESHVSSSTLGKSVFDVVLVSDIDNCISDASRVELEVFGDVADRGDALVRPKPLYQLIDGDATDDETDVNSIVLEYCLGEGVDGLLDLKITPVGEEGYNLKWYDLDEEKHTGWIYDSEISNEDVVDTNLQTVIVSDAGCVSNPSFVLVSVTDEYIEGKTPAPLFDVSTPLLPLEYCAGAGGLDVLPEIVLESTLEDGVYLKWFDESLVEVTDGLSSDGLSYDSKISSTKTSSHSFSLIVYTNGLNCASEVSTVEVKVVDDGDDSPSVLNDVSLEFCIGEFGGEDGELPNIEFDPVFNVGDTKVDTANYSLKWFADEESEPLDTTWSYYSELSNRFELEGENSVTYKVRVMDDATGCSSGYSDVTVEVLDYVTAKAPSDLIGQSLTYCVGEFGDEVTELPSLEFDLVFDVVGDTDVDTSVYRLRWFTESFVPLDTTWSYDSGLSNRFELEGDNSVKYKVRIIDDKTGCGSNYSTIDVEVLDYVAAKAPTALENQSLKYCIGEFGDEVAELPNIEIETTDIDISTYSLSWFTESLLPLDITWSYDSDISNRFELEGDNSVTYKVRIINDMTGCGSNYSDVNIEVLDHVAAKAPSVLAEQSLSYCVGEIGDKEGDIPTIDITPADAVSTTTYDLRWFNDKGISIGESLGESWTLESGISNLQESSTKYLVRLRDVRGCSSDYSDVNIEVLDYIATKAPSALAEQSLAYCVGELGGVDDKIPEIDITPADLDSTTTYDLRWFNEDGISIGESLEESWTLESDISNLQRSVTTYKVRLRDVIGCSSLESIVNVLVSDKPSELGSKVSDPLAVINLDYCINDGEDGVIPTIDLTSYVDSRYSLRWFKGLDELTSGLSLETNILNNRSSTNDYQVRLVNDIGCGSEPSNVTINVSDNPIANFEYGVSCDQTLWLNDLSTVVGLEDADSLSTWNWVLSDGSSLVRLDSLSEGEYDQLSVTSGVQFVTLEVTSEVGCMDIETKKATIPASVSVEKGAVYTEDFNSANWISTVDNNNVSSLDSSDDDELNLIKNSSWDYYTTADDRSVVIVAGNDEYSWIESPCIDLNSWSIPKISLDMKYLTNELEGAVLQYRIKGNTPLDDSNWENLGGLEGGLNWFTSGSISSAPGGSITGWSGQSELVSEDGWLKASYGLSAVQETAGASAVQFRLAYASLDLPIGSREGQGVLVDLIAIEEKQRVSLVEHFTNLNDASITEERANVMELAAPSDVVYIQYHTLDPLPDELDSSYYSSENTSKGVLSGKTLVNGHGDDDVIESWGEDQYSYETLLSPTFDIELSYDPSIRAGEPLQVTASATRNAVSYTVLDTAKLDLLMLLNVAVVEKQVDTKSGMQSNVLVKFLPEYGANYEWGNWYRGEQNQISMEATWDIPIDASAGQFALVAWIEQSSTTKYEDILSMTEVYQVAMMDIDMDLSETVQVLDVEKNISNQLSVYPVPAKDELMVVSEVGLILSDWEIRNLQGQLIESGSIAENKLVIDLTEVSIGLYILGVQTNEGFVMKKFIKE